MSSLLLASLRFVIFFMTVKIFSCRLHNTTFLVDFFAIHGLVNYYCSLVYARCPGERCSLSFLARICRRQSSSIKIFSTVLFVLPSPWIFCTQNAIRGITRWPWPPCFSIVCGEQHIEPRCNKCRLHDDPTPVFLGLHRAV